MNRLTRYALGLLVEEMGEALQMIGKALRFGLDAPGPKRAPYFGKTARQLLATELGDVQAGARYASRAGVIAGAVVDGQCADKLECLLDPESRDSGGGRLAPDTIDRAEFDEDEAVLSLINAMHENGGAALVWSMSDLSDDQAARARAGVRAILALAS